jgi:hypothetical protein
MAMLGITEGLTPEEMASNGAAVQANITAALTAIAEKGITVPDGADSDDLETLIRSISGGTVEALKTVTPSRYMINIEPSEGYDSMKKVIVLSVPYQEIENAAGGKTVKIGT